MALQARAAAQVLSITPTDAKNRWLSNTAEAITHQSARILEANNQDLQASQSDLDAAGLDRLRLTPARLKAIVESLRQVICLPDPVGEVRESYHRPNGLRVEKVGVPLGVIFFIYESRPNVSVDAAALCVKSGNAVILRGGKEALRTNTVLHEIMTSELDRVGLPRDAVQLVPTPDRVAVGHFLHLPELIDIVIPRGGKSLIEYVSSQAQMPVLKHYDGNCHVYVDRAADLNMAEQVILNAKCQRPGVCNAAESLLIHAEIAKLFLPRLGHALNAQGVQIRGCPLTCRLISHAVPATEEDYRTEYLDLIVSIKVVSNLDEAVSHINKYGSHHTDAIITQDELAAQKFVQRVDSAAVMVNASTRFHDGFELGLGAEIGISTDKFHARGPCGLRELTTYKYVIRGEGHVRT
jgi:glutamate-5-semialdehyde dehydrogenase